MTSKFDYIVVGAGIEGSWTAYHLVKIGYKVLLLEQFTLPHSRGSSHGQSRITRYGYAEEFHTSLMDEAYSKWNQLEKEAGVTLFVETGALYLADKKSHKELDSLVSNLRQQPNVIYKTLNSEEVGQIFPQANFGKEYNACWEKNAGVLFADKCLSTVQKRFKDLGGVLVDGFEVQKIEPGPPAVVQGMRIRIRSKNNPVREEESFLANSVIVCAGPWSGPLLKKTVGLNLPLSPRRINVLYWRVKDKLKGSMPVVFIDHGDNGEFYGLPSLEYPDMVKICYHHQKEEEEADPNTRDKFSKRLDNKVISKYVQKHFPSLEPHPSITETCMYTVTPDSICILDKHPLHENIIFGCGFSGTGFKISPVVGHILGNMAQGKAPEHNIKPFAMSRFQNNGRKAKL